MKLKSSIDPNSEAFAKNAAHHRGLAQQLRERAAQIALGGPEEARARHTERGKLLPRERVERLLDPGAPFRQLARGVGVALRSGGIGRRWARFLRFGRGGVRAREKGETNNRK